MRHGSIGRAASALERVAGGAIDPAPCPPDFRASTRTATVRERLLSVRTASSRARFGLCGPLPYGRGSVVLGRFLTGAALSVGTASSRARFGLCGPLPHGRGSVCADRFLTAECTLEGGMVRIELAARGEICKTPPPTWALLQGLLEEKLPWLRASSCRNARARQPMAFEVVAGGGRPWHRAWG